MTNNDYNNMIGTVLNGNDAPDIYVSYSWMYGRERDLRRIRTEGEGVGCHEAS